MVPGRSRRLRVAAGLAAGFVVAATVAGPALATIVLPIHPHLPTDDAWTVVHDRKLHVGVPGVLKNDDDGDGHGADLQATLVTPPAHGSLDLDADGSFTYRPKAGFVGVDGFVYVADDGTGPMSAAVVLTVTDKPPSAKDDAYTIRAGTKLSVGKPGVLGNDTDPDGDSLVAKLAREPRHGSLTLDGRGSFVYRPDDGFTGTDAFTYRPFDGAKSGSAAKVTITVRPGPAATVGPKPTPTPRPDRTPRPRPDRTPAPSESPESGATGGGGGDVDGGGGDIQIGGSDGGSDGELSATGAGLATAFDGFSWQVPMAVLTVPGLLVVLAVVLQVLGATAWLPVIRRRLGNNR